MIDSLANSIAGEIFSTEASTVNPQWLTEERYAQLHTAKRTWVGLTADEMEGLYQLATYMDETDYIHMLMMAEDKLKEKNT